MLSINPNDRNLYIHKHKFEDQVSKFRFYHGVLGLYEVEY